MSNPWSLNGGWSFGNEWDPLSGNGNYSRKEWRYDGDRHICIIGPNGSGKSRRALLKALAELTGYSMIVVDPKGDLCAMSRKHREKHGSLIRTLNPWNAFRLGDDGHDPLTALDTGEDFIDDAMAQSEAIITMEGKEPHWAQSAQELVSALIMYTRLVLKGTYADVRALLSLDDTGFVRLVLGGRDLNRTTYEAWQDARATKETRDAFAEFHPTYRPPFAYQRPGEEEKLYPGIIVAGRDFGWEEMGLKASRFGDITPENREIHSVISTALTQTRWLDSRQVKASLVGKPFDFSILRDRPTTVYLILPARRLGTHRQWLRLIIASALQQLLKDTTRPKVPTILAIDEYYAIARGGFPIIEDNMAMFRGFFIKLVSVFQDLSQATKLYGEDGFETFLANAGVVQAFGTQDLKTSQYLSRRTGEKTRLQTTTGRSYQPNAALPGGLSVSDSSSLAQVQLPIIRAQDINLLPDGYTLLFSHKFTDRTVGGAYLGYEQASTKELLRLDPSS